ncbi:MAG: hypothetical protein IJ617_05285, partial [Oscillospiraceae bacterium]|nr:hypothetical protein [Oscillospiraceae bacterium]
MQSIISPKGRETGRKAPSGKKYKFAWGCEKKESNVLAFTAPALLTGKNIGGIGKKRIIPPTPEKPAYERLGS